MIESLEIQLKKGVFIVAEMSSNHNGSLKIAIETIKAAKRAGASAVKLQTFKPDSMTLNSNAKDFIINNGTIWDGQSLYKLYKKAQTPWEWHSKLFKVANDQGLICFSSPFDRLSVDFLESLNCPIYKIASFEITDIPLIEYIASKGKPIILSTGIAKLEDIYLALETIRSKSKNKVFLLKCTSSYPAPVEEANLYTMSDFKKKFDIIPGLSDHTLGIEVPIVATALGARIIEKHIILDKKINSLDNSFSLDEKEFSNMVRSIRIAEKSLGKISYELTDKQVNGRNFSRSLYVIKNVKKGELISMENVKSIRPGYGIHPKFLKEILGKKFKVDVIKGTALSKELFIE